MDLKEEMLEFRAKHNLSQRKAADMARITSQTWYSVEKGYQNPSALTEHKIRRAMLDATVNQPNQTL